MIGSCAKPTVSLSAALISNKHFALTVASKKCWSSTASRAGGNRKRGQQLPGLGVVSRRDGKRGKQLPGLGVVSRRDGKRGKQLPGLGMIPVETENAENSFLDLE